MDSLIVFKNAKELAKSSGISCIPIIKEVPLEVLFTTLKYISFNDILSVLKDIPLRKIIRVLKIVDVSQIKEVSYERLRVVIEYGDVKTLETVQRDMKIMSTTLALNSLSADKIKQMLLRNDINYLKEYISTFDLLQIRGYV